MRKILNIKLFRRDFAITQQKMAELLQCSQTYISSLERGERDLTSQEEVLLRENYGDDVIDKYITETAELETKQEDNYGKTIEALTKTILSQQKTIDGQQATITHLLNIISKIHDQHQRI